MGNYAQISSVIPSVTEDPRRVPCLSGPLLTNRFTKGPFLTILKFNSTALQLTHSKYTMQWVLVNLRSYTTTHPYVKVHF